MRELAYIADDFGRNASINATIIHAFQEGVLTGASLMLGQPGTDEAVALARNNLRLQIGWHLHLCDSVPTTTPEWPWGSSPLRAGVRLAFVENARRLARAEIQRQWELFQATGLHCEFCNSHHHLHLHPFVIREIRTTVGAAYSGWLRGFDFRLWGRGDQAPPRVPALLRADSVVEKVMKKTSVPTNWGGWATRLAGKLLSRPLASRWRGEQSQTVWGLDRLYRMNASEIRNLFTSLPNGRHEFVFHPGVTSPDLDLAALIELRTKTP